MWPTNVSSGDSEGTNNKNARKARKKSINWIDTVKRNLTRSSISICMQHLSFVDFTHQFSYIF